MDSITDQLIVLTDQCVHDRLDDELGWILWFELVDECQCGVQVWYGM